jgi:serine/threonine protein kinase
MRRFDADKWAAISPYLDQALDLSDDERVRWLAGVERENPALARDLQSLIDDHRAADRSKFLEGTASPQLLPIAGTTVGAYTLVAPIGHGGMGTVWLARRSDGRFDGPAAVKLLNVALAGTEGEARFRREGQILARLTHPHIAHLIDAGVAPGGQLYLVLEYVEGQPIDAYCAGRGLEAAARIDLFLQVLDAVAHAHANLVIHRDLKPSNVLVRDDGHVKLLDFGIATLVESEGEMATRLTREGGRAMTPAFAAPEQIVGERITTATDVYALGVLLYVLLTGRHPAGDAAQSPLALVKAIAESEPRRGSDAADTAAARRALRGDLDTILAKALKKNPQERYGSVSAMADDLIRSRRHEPIAARADSWRYRAAKFVRRHRLFVTATVAILATLAAGLYATNRQRAIAERRFVLVRQLASRLFDIDVQVRALPGSVKARQLIVDTSLEYLRLVGTDVRGDSDLALEIGTAYMRVARVQGVPISGNLGQLDQADQTLRTASRFIEAVLAARPRDPTATLRAAQIAHDRMILVARNGAGAEAANLARESARRLDQYLAAGPIDPLEKEQVVITMMNVANRYLLSGNADEALRMARRAGEIARSTGQPHQAGAALMVVTQALRARGDLQGALAAIDEAAALEEPSAQDGIVRRLLYGLALIRRSAILGGDAMANLGRLDDAVADLERAYAIAESIVRQDATETLGRERLSFAASRLAAIVRHHDPARALALYDEALRRTAEIKNNARARRDEARLLAESTYPLRTLHRLDEARVRLRRAEEALRQLNMYPAVTVEAGSETGALLLASVLLDADAGNLTTAVAEARTLLDLVSASRSSAGSDLSEAEDVARLYSEIAAVYRRAGRTDLAADLDARRAAVWRPWIEKLPAAVRLP